MPELGEGKMREAGSIAGRQAGMQVRITVLVVGIERFIPKLCLQGTDKIW
jgi:hypothetical protein